MNKLIIFLGTLCLCMVAANAAESNLKTLTGPALITQVCNTMTNKDLCISNLTADPGSKNADLTRLTLISIRLATYNVADTLSFITGMQQDESLDAPVAKCYTDCAGNYNAAMEQLDDSFAPLVAKDYVDVKKRIETAMLSEDACEVCFKDLTHKKKISERNRMFRNLAMNTVSLVEALQKAKP